MAGFLRHLRACRNAGLPGGRAPFRLGGIDVGWVAPADVEAVRAAGARPEGAALTCPAAALPGLGERLAASGHVRWRDEAFDVAAGQGMPRLSTIDRGALPLLGLHATGVHLNAAVGEALWVSRRSPTKRLDPDKLDNLVGGGVASGQSGAEALAKEAGEEAGIDAATIRRARFAARIDYAMQRDEGLRRDTLLCYDLELPAAFEPVAVDGEVVAFHLLPFGEAVARVAETDDFKFNVALVLIDLFLRRGLIPAREDGVDLARALASPGTP